MGRARGPCGVALDLLKVAECLSAEELGTMGPLKRHRDPTALRLPSNRSSRVSSDGSMAIVIA